MFNCFSVLKLFTGTDVGDLLKYAVIIIAILAAVFLLIKVEGVRWFAVIAIVLVVGFTGVYSGIKINQYYTAEGGIYGKLEELIKPNQVAVEQEKTYINFDFKNVNLTKNDYGYYSARFVSNDVISLDSYSQYFSTVNSMPCKIIEYDKYHFVAKYNYSFYDEQNNYILTDELIFTFGMSQYVTELVVASENEDTRAVELWNVYFTKNDFIVKLETTDKVYISDTTNCSVTFMVDDEVFDTQSILYGTCATLPEEPIKEGYIFKGWSTDGDNIIDNLGYLQINSDTTFIAVFEINVYSVTFKVNGDNYDTQSISHGNCAVSPEAPTKIGYKFLGWSIDGQNLINNINTTPVTKSITYKAVFEEIVATFDTDYMTQLTAVNSAVTKQTISSMSFLSYTDKTEKFTTLNSGIDVYYSLDEGLYEFDFVACKIYAPDSCYKLFNNYGGNILNLSNFDTSEVTNMSGMFEFCHSLSALDLSYFNTSKVTDMSFMFNSFYCFGGLDLSNFDTYSVQNMSFMFASCSSFVSFDLSNFDTSEVTNMSYMFWNCYNLEILDLSNFYTDKVSNWDSMYYGCSNLHLVKIGDYYELDNLKHITFMSDDVDVLSYYTYSGCLIVPDNPTKTGYKFLGWSLDGETTVNTSINITSDMTFIALFEIDVYTVTFTVDDEDFDTQSISYGNCAVLPDNPTKTGYEFLGWSIDGEGIFEGIETTVVTESVTYRALFDINVYTVTFMVDDEDFDTQSISYGNCAVLPNNPTKTGYRFLGWSLDGDTIVEDIETTAVTEPVTYVAVFEEFVAFTFEYNSNGYYTLTGVSADYSESTLEIPSTYDDGTNGSLPVKYIGSYVLQQGLSDGIYASSITEVIIPDTVISLDEYAFYSCISLNLVTISCSLSQINRYAFCGCSNLTTVNFEARTTNIVIYAYAFKDCLALSYVYCENIETQVTTYIINNINSVGNSSLTNNVEWSFSPTYDLDYMTFTYSSNGGGYYTLTAVASDCDISTITVPRVYDDGTHGCLFVKVIGDGSNSVFDNCYFCTGIIIPKSVMIIQGKAFSSCYWLTTVNFEARTTNITIESKAFSGCRGLTTVYCGNTETFTQTYIKSNINSTGNSYLTDAIWYYESNLNSTNLSASNVISNNVYDVCYNLTPVILGKNYTLDNLPTTA